MSAIQIHTAARYRRTALVLPKSAGKVRRLACLSFSISLVLLVIMMRPILMMKGSAAGKTEKSKALLTAATIPMGMRPPMTKPETNSPIGR